MKADRWHMDRQMVDRSVFSADTILGNYRIIAKIGARGMGEVYRAHDTRLHRMVAIKVLPREFIADPAHRRRFLHEARAASA